MYHINQSARSTQQPISALHASSNQSRLVTMLPEHINSTTIKTALKWITKSNE